jgi:hypothetical protein
MAGLPFVPIRSTLTFLSKSLVPVPSKMLNRRAFGLGPEPRSRAAEKEI